MAPTKIGPAALRPTGYFDSPGAPWRDRLGQWVEAYEAESCTKTDPIAHAASRSFEAFIRFTFPDYQWSWHNELIAKELQWWVDTEGARLVIDAPPRHGKTEQVSRRLPPYALGRNPDATIISASHTMGLAKRNNRDVQRIMDSPEYKRVFPGVELYGKESRKYADGVYERNSQMFEIVNRKGSYKAAGTGVGIAGMGFTHGIIDDPVKDRKAAESPTQRQALIDWYSSTFLTRQAPGARILITQTRWHYLDLTGHVKELAAADPKADQWRVIHLPAICESPEPYDKRKPGEALWSDRYPLEALERLKASVSPRDWQALYQGRPSATAGIGICYNEFATQNIVSLQPSQGDQLFWALDFNINPMSSLYGFMRNGHVHVLGELVIPQCTIDPMCEAFRTRIRPVRQALGYGEYSSLPLRIYGDASGKIRDMGGDSAWRRVREWMTENQSSFRADFRVLKGNPSHVDRVASVNALLCSASGVRRLTIDSSCRELRLDFERVSWAQDAAGRSIGQISKADPNRTHTSDALGYMTHYEFPQTHRGGFGTQVII